LVSLDQSSSASRLLHYLETLRFPGDVEAMPEGTIFFSHEPILRIIAPLPQAQLVESRVVNLLNFHAMMASKAARSVLVSGGKPLIDFGRCRAHRAEAGLLASQVNYLARHSLWSSPDGTMAHSFVQADHDEALFFEHFAEIHPNNAILLIDTYNAEAAADKVMALAQRLHAKGITLKGIRLDSGDLADHARNVRRMVDGGGLSQEEILGSGNLDKYRWRVLVQTERPLTVLPLVPPWPPPPTHPHWTAPISSKNMQAVPAASKSVDPIRRTNT
jgi:nicotinate phosphoribosyltransferase